MVVVYGCNRGWYKYLVVGIYSLLKYNPSVEKIYILCEDDSINDIDYLSEISQEFNVEMVVQNIVPLINKYYKGVFNNNTIYTDFAYAKLLISEVVLEDKVLYLDIDTIVKGDISSLSCFNIDDYYAAGVKDNGGFLNGHNVSLGIKDKYMNTGVMYLNTKKIRDDELIPRFFDVINSKNLRYPDQDAFNVVCNGNILYLSSMYNFAFNEFFQVTRHVFHQRLRKIIHYTGNKLDWVADKFCAEEWYVEYEDFYNKFINPNPKKNIKVAFCSNKRLYKYLAININSLLKYNNLIEKIYLVLEDDDIEDVPYLQDVISKYDVNYEVINFSKVQFNFLSKSCQNLDTIYSNFCFAKLLLSEFTSEDKIIYLDMDTIVRGNISMLWNFDLNDYYALGARDYGVLDENNHYGTLHTDCKYINTGVMVLNLKKFRSDDMVTKLFKYINENKLVYPDQDAFNLVCNSKIGYIPSIYNCVWGVTKDVRDYDKSVIFHFPGEKLYWVTDRKHSEEYYEEYCIFLMEYNISDLSFL